MEADHFHGSLKSIKTNDMIIKRKLFTRSEKKIIHELYNTTKGFRNLPKGYKNMTVRDAIRLDNIARGYYRGNFNPEDVQVLATHLGLPETAKGGTRVLQKYTNPELLERWHNIRAHKLGVGKEREEFKALEKELLELRTKRDNSISDKEWYSYRDKIENWWDKNEGRFAELQNLLSEKLKPGNDKLNNRIDNILKKQNALKNKALLETERTTVSDPELSWKLVEDARNRQGIEHIYLREGNPGLISRERTMYLGEANKYDPAAIGHEAGHQRTYDRQIKQGLGRNIDELQELNGDWWRGEPGQQIRMNPAFPLGNEYRASLESVMAHKRVGATPKQIADSLRNHEAAYKSYYHDASGEIPTRTMENLTRI